MPKIKIGEVCTFLNGGTPARNNPKFYEGDIPWITSADITGAIVSSARSFITREAVKSSATNLIEKGTILFVTRTGVGKVAVAGMDLCFSQDITAIKHDPKVVFAPYLVHLLASKQSYFKRFERGATIKGITREVIEDLEIDLPPLAEQKRIAAILDKADHLRQLRRQAIQKLDELLQSVFVEMFGDARSINSLTIADAMEAIIDYRGKSPTKTESGIPLVTAKIVRQGYITEANEFIAETDYDSWMRRGLPEKGDVVFTTEAPMGNVAQLISPRVALAQRIILLRGKSNVLDNTFLAYALRTPMVREQLVRRATGSTVLGIRQAELRKVELPIPSMKQQMSFKRIAAHYESIAKLLEKQEAYVDHLSSSLQSSFL